MAADELGFRGQAPHDIFQQYMEQIVNDPAFEGMPDTHYDDGRIQWEAPSNRAGGKFKDTHQRRREWWTRKADSLGISTLEGKWISRVAKAIYPTKRKPCKKCGQVMDIRYVYPRQALLNKIAKVPHFGSDFETSLADDIFVLISRLYDQYQDKALGELPSLLNLKADYPAADASLREWLVWIENVYVPGEPTTLSPGVMANPPDRFDGFHSFNRCCRSTADTGRTATNLRSYTTDRRVFEYWASGDWIAADRLMGILRRDFRNEICLNGHPGPCQADHIGPISLGFNHRPHFQLLCGSCNSAKNNRMYPSDIAWLIEREKSGEEVISWHSKTLWDICKYRVSNQEHSLRLSKVLRDNRHCYMHALSVIAANGHFAFLASLLELSYAEFDVEFVGLKIVDHITSWEEIRHIKRETKYAAEQKTRRSRIAFGELLTYFDRTNRNSFVVETQKSAELLKSLLEVLDQMRSTTNAFDRAISASCSAHVAEIDEKIRATYDEFSDFDFAQFGEARTMLRLHMDEIGEKLASMWDDERFTRQLQQVDVILQEEDL